MIQAGSNGRPCSSHGRLVVLACIAAASCAVTTTRGANAQIKQPGAHAKYSVELEPHATVWWQDASNDYYSNNSGWGLGMRASIPLVDNGFVPSINNNVALGFGLDWGHYSHQCYWWGWNRNDPRYYGNNDCTANTIWVPVVMQWNFFITKAFSVFGEPGLAIRHSWWHWGGAWCGPANNAYQCDWSDSNTGLEPVFFVGGRVGNDKVSFTFRLGWPYASLGASFFL